MSMNLLSLIESGTIHFSKGQKRIAEYVLGHYDKAAFVTAARLGQTVGVSESTVVRFAMELGYDGYPQFQKALQELVKSSLTSVQRMEVTNERLGDDDVVQRVLTSDVDKIKKTLELVDRVAFDQAVDAILGAKNIYIVGVRSAAGLAQFLNFYFSLMFKNVHLVSILSISEMFEEIMHIDKGDVMIGISFPRYSRRTVTALRYAASRGGTVISLTDSEDSPLAALSSITLLARSDMLSFVDSLVAPMSLINALILALGMKKQEEMEQTFENLEHLWDEYNVYEKPEDFRP